MNYTALYVRNLRLFHSFIILEYKVSVKYKLAIFMFYISIFRAYNGALLCIYTIIKKKQKTRSQEPCFYQYLQIRSEEIMLYLQNRKVPFFLLLSLLLLPHLELIIYEGQNLFLQGLFLLLRIFLLLQQMLIDILY